MRVAVLGGGPAGAFAAERLAEAGVDTLLFDEKLAWEKPCGGGLTFKAYQRYPFLIDNPKPKRLITRAELAAPGAATCRMDLKRPLVVYARMDLNHLLLERAAKAGARIEQERVTGLERRDGGWSIETRHGRARVTDCIIATGARNPFRSFGTQWTSADTMQALGYYLPADQEHIDIQFLDNFQGYIWVFPRCGHLSVGICGKGESARQMKRRLELFMAERGFSWKDAPFYAHVLPSLGPGSWRRNRVSGDGWMAVGDAGGLVDPLTGEGLYYALRSADLAAQVLVEDRRRGPAKAVAYRRLLFEDFVGDLEFASRLAKRLFLGRLLFGSVPARVVGFSKRSSRFLDLIQDLIAGTQSYLGLKNRLLRSLNGTLQEIVMSFFFRRVLPSQAGSR